MSDSIRTVFFFLTAIAFSAASFAAEKSPSRPDLKTAINKSIALLEKASAGSAKKRRCFTCHNQALPVITLVDAKRRGFKIDAANLQTQLKHTAAHLERGKPNYLKGRGQGGRASTAGHALWALEAGGWKPDDATKSVVHYLLQYRRKAGHWPHTSNRPPSGKSHFSATYMVLRGLDRFGTKANAEQIKERKQAALAWALKTKARDTEDRVFRLLTLHRLQAKPEELATEAKRLLSEQRDDGGWSQKPEMTSDGYATGGALFALSFTGQLKTSSEVWKRGVAFLLKSQQADGSWKVKSRSKPFQTYYETGYPHGKDQFISIAAGCWATMALLREFSPR